VKLQINNNVLFHLEIIESLICKHEQIVKEKCNDITLNLCQGSDPTFIKYILGKYKDIRIGNQTAKYYIHATAYDKDIQKINMKEKNHFFICHNFDEKTKENNNIFYLTPLAGKNYIKPNILPIISKQKTEHPIYVVQGNITERRRNYDLIINILKNTPNLKYQFKFIGRGNGLPKELLNDKRVVCMRNLSFLDFHRCFSDAYCILPTITKETHPNYYTNKLTSSVSYISGFDLPCIIDSDLQSIYNLKNAYVFEQKEDLILQFMKSYEDFYK